MKVNMKQVDRDAIKEVNENLSKLGVCDYHFQFDNKYLHKPLVKKSKNFETGIIQWHRLYQPICTWTFNDIKRLKSICYLYYEKPGGHIYHHPGKEKKGTFCLHLEDTSKGIEFLGNLLIDISQTQDEKIKEQILIVLISTLTPFASFSFFNKKTFIKSDSNSTNTNIDNFNYTSTNKSNINEKLIITQLSSLFIIKTLFIGLSDQIKNKWNLKSIDFNKLGCIIGDKLWNSYSNITAKKSSLESPQTIQDYYNAFLDFFTSFFSGMIHKLQEKK
ncbi:hypothetical protein C1645_838195 [Glomus cerebriforme]|uniref:Uncharacterized protein n=1 Tax=Glomus cerebriforme TaxID=658196 RepID=A0A397S7L0_9GLOM|nr:hypothetical protein C1645_838195 [Glomus cerebriforme]